MPRFYLRSSTQVVYLPLGRFSIGRAAECTLRVDDESLSRRHVSLRIETDKVEVRDAGSRNGVFVNGVRLRSPQYIVPGDELRFGASVFELIAEPTRLGSDAPTQERGSPQRLRPAGAAEDVPLDTLSEREREVLELFVRGHATKQIAERLGIGPKSVETYRSRVSQKLGLRERAELVAYALRNGILTAES